MLSRGILGPFEIVWQSRGGEPVVALIGGLGEAVGPAFHEEPPCLFGEFVAGQLGVGFQGVSGEAFHDGDFGSVDFDVGGGCAVGWVVGVGAADVGDFEHHVRGSIFFPERDANVLHTVTYRTELVSQELIDGRYFVVDLRLRSAYLRKYGWIATLLIEYALSGIPQALWLALSCSDPHTSCFSVGVFNWPSGKYFMFPW